MKIIKKYKKVFIRPILYRSVAWGSIALAAALCWNRFINVDNFLSMGRDAFLVVSVVFWVLGWFEYLKADGVKVPGVRIRPEKRKPKRHGYGDMIDFADEHITTFDELSAEEQNLCRLATDVILGILFLLLSLFNR